MPFTSIPRLVVAANNGANLLRRASGRPRLQPWDPTACDPWQQEDIGNAFFSLKNSQLPEIRGRGADWAKLADLMEMQTVDSLSIACSGCRGGNPMSSNADSKSLEVCLDTSQRNLLAYWLVVEVVHLCGGTDLDAWAVKNWLFSVNKGSYPYSWYPLAAQEKALMCAGGRRLPTLPYLAGEFTVWDNVTGNLWPSLHLSTGVFPRQPSLIDPGINYWQYHC
jgi:hypothetical protein